jgi:hypothetical protein
MHINREDESMDVVLKIYVPDPEKTKSLCREREVDRRAEI